ncbi:hypothetical protein G6O69_21160 [Pseudenhygromyxa sp. WMMC2535]|uniref:hypothetical protein n=1 Tax=Pseudenhygromyxa sp. WMMC2535 TaxID=2712867 RepID=UPI001556FA07|nr:hypothetical protein [Pseudenhygromyxa sp. WMMC2535]NVB40362.1 hypothetical protein [Pseudenhygromyxa sp. WMMC2535]
MAVAVDAERHLLHRRIQQHQPRRRREKEKLEPKPAEDHIGERAGRLPANEQAQGDPLGTLDLLAAIRSQTIFGAT